YTTLFRSLRTCGTLLAHLSFLLSLLLFGSLFFGRLLLTVRCVAFGRRMAHQSERGGYTGRQHGSLGHRSPRLIGVTCSGKSPVTSGRWVVVCSHQATDVPAALPEQRAASRPG